MHGGKGEKRRGNTEVREIDVKKREDRVRERKEET